MKISFLVTYYNQKQYVAQSLESILAIRKPCEWEILVGDDGSSDGTQDVVREYIRRYPDNIFLHIMPRDPAVKYAPVQRASANRINLLEHATGDFYCVLDGDDYYCDDNFVEDALRVFCAQDNLAMVMFGFKHVIDGRDGRHITLPERLHERIVEKSTYLDGLYIPAGACVFRKIDDPKRMRLLKGMGYFDDNNIVIYNMYFGEMYCINRVVYSYRQTGSSIYTSMDMIEQAVLNVQGYDVDKKLIDDKYQKNLLRRNAAQILIMYGKRNNLQITLGEEKYQSYLRGCEPLGNSLAYSILNYNRLNRMQKRSVDCAVLAASKIYPKFVVKLLLKTLISK